MNDQMEIVEVVYLGFRQLKNNKKAQAYILLSEFNKLQESSEKEVQILERANSIFEAKKEKEGVIGAIYDMKCKIEDNKITTASTSTKTYKQLIPNHEWRKVLDGIDLAQRTRYKHELQIIKVGANHAIESDIKSLREIYHKLPYADRTAFEMTILNLIRRRV